MVVVLVKHQDFPPLSTFIHVEYFFPLNSNGMSQISSRAVLHSDVLFQYSFERKNEKQFLTIDPRKMKSMPNRKNNKVNITSFVVIRNNFIVSFFASQT